MAATNSTISDSSVSNPTPNGIGSSLAPLTTDYSHPLYLHPSDHPGMVLVSVRFNGSGFPSWKRSMMIALSAKNKIGFINGTCQRPSSDSNMLRQWERCNDMVISWILNALEQGIADSVLYSRDAASIWEELEERFGQANGAQLFQIQKDLISSSQGSTGISEYYTKLKRLWDELSTLRSLPPCTCDAAKAWQKFDQELKLIQFLMGLNEGYINARGNILMMQPLPSLGQAYSLLIQEEKQREVQATTHFLHDSAALNVGVNRFSHKGKTDLKKSPLFCDYCKKAGHPKEKCYRLIGFPPNFKFTKSKRVAANVIGADHSLSPALEMGSAHLSTNTPHGTHDNMSPASQASGVPGLSQEQYSQLLQLLNSTKVSKEKSENQPFSGSINFAGPFNEEASGSW